LRIFNKLSEVEKKSISQVLREIIESFLMNDHFREEGFKEA